MTCENPRYLASASLPEIFPSEPCGKCPACEEEKMKDKCSNCDSPTKWLPYVGGEDDSYPVHDDNTWADGGCKRDNKCSCGAGECLQPKWIAGVRTHDHLTGSDHFTCGTEKTNPRTPCVKGDFIDKWLEEKPAGDGEKVWGKGVVGAVCSNCKNIFPVGFHDREVTAKIRSLQEKVEDLEEAPDYECEVCNADCNVDEGAICQRCWTDDARENREKVLTRRTEKIETLQEKVEELESQQINDHIEQGRLKSELLDAELVVKPLKRTLIVRGFLQVLNLFLGFLGAFKVFMRQTAEPGSMALQILNPFLEGADFGCNFSIVKPN